MHIRRGSTSVIVALGCSPLLTVVSATASLAAPPDGQAGSQAGTHPPAALALVPAFSTDLPVGSTRLGIGSSAPSATSSSTVVASPDAAPWVCTVYASDRDLEGIEIHGEGTQFCSGIGYTPTKINVAIQAYKGLGLWADRYKAVGEWSSAYFDTLEAWYDCSGDGTYTYRIVTDGWAQSGLCGASVQSGNYLRVTC